MQMGKRFEYKFKLSIQKRERIMGETRWEKKRK